MEGFALAADVDLVSAAVDHHATADYRAWIAVDGPHDAADPGNADGEFVGFVTTDVKKSPSVFDRPDRLVVGDLYVRESYRGTGLARRPCRGPGPRARLPRDEIGGPRRQRPRRRVLREAGVRAGPAHGGGRH